MKTRTLTVVGILLCSLVLGSSLVRADQDYYYQGRHGRWARQHNAWRFSANDGYEYRNQGHSWGWYNGRRHGAEGREYHNRAYGDNRTYNQFQRQERW